MAIPYGELKTNHGVDSRKIEYMFKAIVEASKKVKGENAINDAIKLATEDVVSTLGINPEYSYNPETKQISYKYTFQDGNSIDRSGKKLKGITKSFSGAEVQPNEQVSPGGSKITQYWIASNKDSHKGKWVSEKDAKELTAPGGGYHFNSMSGSQGTQR
jgi:hypothetical protein